MKLITLEEFKNGKIAINTRSQEEYDSLMKFFDSKEIVWLSGHKATERKSFKDYREETCILLREKGLTFSNKACEKGKRHKIITPNELKEYNEFLGKPKEKAWYDYEIKPDQYITTHAELLKLHGRSVTCKINGKYIEDAKVSVDKGVSEYIYICQNIRRDGAYDDADFLFDYKCSLLISSDYTLFEKRKDHRGVTEIKLKEEYLSIGQAIDYMLESEKNEIEYTDPFNGNKRYRARIVDKTLKYLGVKKWSEDKYSLSGILEYWKNIKKHIEEPKKTLKEKLETKQPFQYKEEWYRFNKDGAIIGSKGNAVSLERIQEILTNRDKK